MEISINGDTPNWMVYIIMEIHENTVEKDDNWGYLHFREPSSMPFQLRSKAGP